MTQENTSVLLISPDQGLSSAVKKVIDAELHITEKLGTVGGLNGSAVRAAGSRRIRRARCIAIALGE